METLGILEKKIIGLVEKINSLQADNVGLVKENIRLKNDLKVLEERISSGTMSIEELNQEKIATRVVVDDLIKHIDLLIEKNQ